VEQLSCQELVELVTSYLEGALPEAERGSFEHHIAGCIGCHKYLQQMRTTIELTGRLSTTDVSREAAAKLLLVFRDWKAANPR
jgi:anti-sigma factor RsiW